MGVICFHMPEEENGYLSNWFLRDFVVDGRTFSSMEQYMMYEKAMCFGDTEIAEKIMSTTDVAKIKKLGREIKNYVDEIWASVRQSVVKRGLYEKFNQYEDLKEMLLDTGIDVIAECAVKDTIWGIGLSMHDDRRFNRNYWKGTNYLGNLLMEVRESFK